MSLFGNQRGKKVDRKVGGDTVLFFATDLHGSNVCWRKFVNSAAFYGADVLILGGDTTGKMVVPVLARPGGTWTASFQGSTLEFRSEEERQRFHKRVSDMGFYPHLMRSDEYAEFAASEERRDLLFLDLIRERWQEWIAFAEDKLAGTGVRVFAAPGNDDFLEVDQIIASSSLITLLEGRVLCLADRHEILTTGWTNPTPWNTERECPEAGLAERLEQMGRQLRDPERAIFNIHVPPYNSRIDSCAKLDPELRVVYDMGNPVQAPAGSTAVRAFIERYQPMLGLHGHIHEGRGETYIGRSLCLNPGSVYTEGILNGVLLTLSEGRIKRYQFTQG